MILLTTAAHLAAAVPKKKRRLCVFEYTSLARRHGEGFSVYEARKRSGRAREGIPVPAEVVGRVPIRSAAAMGKRSRRLPFESHIPQHLRPHFSSPPNRSHLGAR